MANSPRGGQVAACSNAAAGQGVHIGMPVAEAQALVRELALVPHEPPADRRALKKLAEACEKFTPWIALEESVEPESLLLDISNLDHLWGSEQDLAAQVEEFFTRRRYRVRLAVADTLSQAWALAHFGSEPASAGGEEAKDCNLHFAISDLPVEALRIPRDTAALIRQLGIQTVAELQSLPREDLASRFGDALLRRLDQFTGAAREVLLPHRGLAALKAACALDQPTADCAMLMHVLAHLVERLTRQLVARDQGAVQLMCVLGSATGRAMPLQIGLVEPSANPRQLLELIELHLETLRLAGEIDRIEIHAAVVGRLSQRQGDLFADRWPADPHQFAVLVNRLSSRLGHEQVLRAELRASAVPERAVRLATMTAEGMRSEERGARKRRVACSRGAKRSVSMSSRMLTSLRDESMPPRPLLLQCEPQPLEVVCVAPDGPPQFVWLEGRRQRITHCAGPERIETLWWRGPSVRRDYYRIATPSGSHLWIFRRLTDTRWFLHGTFD